MLPDPLSCQEILLRENSQPSPSLSLNRERITRSINTTVSCTIGSLVLCCQNLSSARKFPFCENSRPTPSSLSREGINPEHNYMGNKDFLVLCCQNLCSARKFSFCKNIRPTTSTLSRQGIKREQLPGEERFFSPVLPDPLLCQEILFL